MEIRAKAYFEAQTNSIKTITVTNIDDLMQSEFFMSALLEEVANKLSGAIIEQCLPEVLERISPDAIANMTIASAGAKINETLNKKMPDKILEITKTEKTHEVWQKGLLGGMRKIS